MGLLKFRIPSPLPEPRVADLRKSYVTGLDRTPSRLSVEVRKDLLVCHRGTTESGRLFAIDREPEKLRRDRDQDQGELNLD